MTRAASSLTFSSSASIALSPVRTFSASSASRLDSASRAVEDRGLDQAAHLDDQRLNRLEVAVVGRDDVLVLHAALRQPIRPEM